MAIPFREGHPRGVKMLAKLKKLATELPGCRKIASWGAETDWSEMSKFAAQYDRETARRNRTRESWNKPVEGARVKQKQKTAYQKSKNNSNNPSEGRSTRSELPRTVYQKSKPQARPAPEKKKPERESTYRT